MSALTVEVPWKQKSKTMITDPPALIAIGYSRVKGNVLTVDMILDLISTDMPLK